MPMPRSWKDTERLAACLAYIEKSEGGDSNTLAQDSRNAYAGQLAYVHQNVKTFESKVSLSRPPRWSRDNPSACVTIDERFGGVRRDETPRMRRLMTPHRRHETPTTRHETPPRVS